MPWGQVLHREREVGRLFEALPALGIGLRTHGLLCHPLRRISRGFAFPSSEEAPCTPSPVGERGHHPLGVSFRPSRLEQDLSPKRGNGPRLGRHLGLGTELSVGPDSGVFPKASSRVTSVWASVGFPPGDPLGPRKGTGWGASESTGPSQVSSSSLRPV